MILFTGSPATILQVGINEVIIYLIVAIIFLVHHTLLFLWYFLIFFRHFSINFKFTKMSGI